MVNSNNYDVALVDLNNKCIADHIKRKNILEPTNDEVNENRVLELPPLENCDAAENPPADSDKGKAITLTKKSYDVLKKLPFDDGLMYKWEG